MEWWVLYNGKNLDFENISGTGKHCSTVPQGSTIPLPGSVLEISRKFLIRAKL